jgi:F-type H+-transporting ATPase subunit delta
MATSEYAKNLAKALFEDATKENDLIGWLREIRLISDIVKDSSVSSALQKPGSSFQEKSNVLKDRMGEVNPRLLNMVGMLADKNKLSEMDDVSLEYQRLVDSYHGIEGAEAAEITTAMPLDEDDKLKMGKRLSEMLGRPVTLNVVVDPALLGGIVIRVGDKLIDGSVRHRLQTLSKELI